MEEIEVPLEQSQEHIHEEAHHHGGWITKVALSTAITAVIAAIASLMAGHHSNEALITQIQASDSWSYYQAKSIKESILSFKSDFLKESGRDNSHDLEKISKYKEEEKEISEKAKEREHESAFHLKKHVILAKAVTFFQISIAVSAIAVLTRRRTFWFVSLGFTTIGLFFFGHGLWFI